MTQMRSKCVNKKSKKSKSFSSSKLYIMDFSQSYSIPYHYTEEDDNNQYQQLLTSPTEELYRSSPWSSTSLVKTEMDCEEISQPERGIAGFVSKLYQ